jgi:hypothetical protein
MNSERRHLTPQEKIAALKRRLLEGVLAVSHEKL